MIPNERMSVLDSVITVFNRQSECCNDLKEKAYFNQVKLKDGTVVWPHDQDICPDTLYLDSK